MEVTLQYIDSETRAQIMEEMDLWESRTLYANLQNGVKATVTSLECDTDGNPEHGYYNITFADGSTCEAIAGMHLKGIENWK